MKILFLIILLLALIILTPFGTIWSLNVLFQLEIVYTIKTWLAIVFLQTVTFGAVNSSIHNLNNKDYIK
jgi:hypothetical protein